MPVARGFGVIGFPPPRGPPSHRRARPTQQYRLQNSVELPIVRRYVADDIIRAGAGQSERRARDLERQERLRADGARRHAILRMGMKHV